MRAYPLISTNKVNAKDNAPLSSRRRVWPLTVRRNTDHLSLSEAAKVELSLVPAKTPVTILQELLCKRGSLPKYELVQIEGAIHEPTFRYRVAFGDTMATGTGRSKKEAKHDAAKNVLLRLVGKSEDDVEEKKSSEVEVKQQNKNEEAVLAFEEKISGNPIGTLQEMCMARRWPPPVYDIIEEMGLPHERFFRIECTLLNFKETGVGKSKKLAKRQAANKMWERLQTVDTEPEESSSTESEEASESEPSAENAESVESKPTPPATTSQSQKIATCHRNLKECTGPKIDELQLGVYKRPDFDVQKFLTEVALEQNFEVTYVEIDERTKSGLYQCLIQLSTIPIAVCYGYGDTMKEAQVKAAYNTLDYLRVMTMKGSFENLKD